MIFEILSIRKYYFIIAFKTRHINIIRTKATDYLYSILQVTKDLPVEIRELIIQKVLITEFKEEIFIREFDKIFEEDIDIQLAIEDFESFTFEEIFTEDNNIDFLEFYDTD